MTTPYCGQVVGLFYYCGPRVLRGGFFCTTFAALPFHILCEGRFIFFTLVALPLGVLRGAGLSFFFKKISLLLPCHFAFC